MPLFPSTGAQNYFTERFTSLKTQLAEQMAKEEELNKRIMDNLANIKIDSHSELDSEFLD